MVAKLLLLCCVVGLAAAGLLHEEEKHAPAHYEFEYSVKDTHTHDIKQQHEARHGDEVQGYYTLLQPDGLTRLVHYKADKKNGFTADVKYEGHAHAHEYAEPAKHTIAHAPVVVAHHAPVVVAHHTPVVVAHHAPVVSHVEYHAAPVAHVAEHHEAAPAHKVKYTKNLGHVKFSTPHFSYHH